MFETMLGFLKKRRRIDPDDHNQNSIPFNNNNNNNNNNNPFWDTLFTNANTNSTTTINSSNITNTNEMMTSNEDNAMAVDLPSIPISNSQIARPFNLNERFVSVLDQLDARVEKFRKDALGLQEKRDFLLMSIDLIKSNDSLQSMSESEREEIICYIQRVNARLSTVELNVRTVRDHSQEDSLSQINALIDMMITLGDPVMSRQRCQQYLNSCCSSAEACDSVSSFSETYAGGIDIDAGPVDKKFESALLGCTLDDQKTIKKRLQALMGYLNKQIIRN